MCRLSPSAIQHVLNRHASTCLIYWWSPCSRHASASACAITASLPSPAPSAVISLKDKGFGVLLEAVLAADKAILDTLSNPELEATVFAPDDKAFVRLLKELGLTKEELLKDKALVTQVGAGGRVAGWLGTPRGCQA